jgi:hypothetical protein
MVVRRREMNDRLRTELDKALRNIIQRYATSFAQKEYEEENNEHDVIMDIFGISPTLKRENRQYWGRELGMCWQLIVSELCRFACPQFGPALRFGGDEPCDFCVAKRAIDTKYRIGSGDAGTLKKFKSYGALLRSKGYTPITLIVRTDNLGAAMTALTAGNWEVYTGTDTFNYVNSLTGFDLMAWLEEIKREGRFRITR